MKLLKTVQIVLALFLVTLTASEKQRIAIVELDKKGITDLEGAAAELSIRNAFVNSAKYKVLDRENMDKVLIERTIASDGLYDKDRATDIGRVLNVHFIMVGTLMKFEGDFLMELRVIDVENSSVAGSSTGRCGSSGELLQLAEYLVNKVCMIDKNVTTPSPKDSSQIDNQKKTVIKNVVLKESEKIDVSESSKKEESFDASLAFKSEPEIMEEEKDSVVDTVLVKFREIGLSLADYDHYKSSKLSIPDWIKIRRKKSSTAALIGFCTGTSGFFYTGDYGTGMLITLSKALGVIGMISNRKKGGAKYWSFAGLTTVAIAADAVGSSIAADKRNEKLNVLLEKLPELGYESESGALSINLVRKF